MMLHVGWIGSVKKAHMHVSADGAGAFCGRVDIEWIFHTTAEEVIRRAESKAPKETITPCKPCLKKTMTYRNVIVQLGDLT